MSKRLFEILDEMNLHDTNEGTKFVKVSNQFVSANLVKHGSKITMGAEAEVITDIALGKAIALLILVDKEAYDKFNV